MTQAREEAGIVGLVGEGVVLRREENVETLPAGGRDHEDHHTVETLFPDEPHGILDRGPDVGVQERKPPHAAG